jgi:hypothetical protein
MKVLLFVVIYTAGSLAVELGWQAYAHEPVSLPESLQGTDHYVQDLCRMYRICHPDNPWR